MGGGRSPGFRKEFRTFDTYKGIFQVGYRSEISLLT